jgi:hypothetical protein
MRAPELASARVLRVLRARVQPVMGTPELA